MSHSVYLADKLHDHVLKGTSYTPPTDVYIALFTSSNGLDDNVEGNWDEVSGNAYARLLINNTTRSFTTSSSKATTNNEDWEFPTATGSWGTISHTAVMDALTSGNVLYWSALQSTVPVALNDVFRFLAGEFDSVIT